MKRKPIPAPTGKEMQRRRDMRSKHEAKLVAQGVDIKEYRATKRRGAGSPQVVFTLVCEDASRLGGPMGSEYTTHVFSKPFKTLRAAQEYAQRHNGEWTKHYKWELRDGKWYVDARSHLYRITPSIL